MNMFYFSCGSDMWHVALFNVRIKYLIFIYNNNITIIHQEPSQTNHKCLYSFIYGKLKINELIIKNKSTLNQSMQLSTILLRLLIDLQCIPTNLQDEEHQTKVVDIIKENIYCIYIYIYIYILIKTVHCRVVTLVLIIFIF